VARYLRDEKLARYGEVFPTSAQTDAQTPAERLRAAASERITSETNSKAALGQTIVVSFGSGLL
jgi:hypothetical protein